MKKMQMIMAVLVLSGCLLAQGCAGISLISKRTDKDVTRIGMFSIDPQVLDGGKNSYFFSLYNGDVSEDTISLIRLYAD